MIAALFFYLYATLLVISAFAVIVSRNPVHAVFFLIFAFFNAAGLFILVGAEFIAMILVVVYVGAVMVLFLFVVMMLDVDVTKLRKSFTDYMPLGAVLIVVLVAEMVMILGAWSFTQEVPTLASVNVIVSNVSNTEAIGSVLYTRYILYFQMAGLVLLIAMIGAISLTLRHRSHVKRQNPSVQSARTVEQSIEIKKVESGKGLG